MSRCWFNEQELGKRDLSFLLDCVVVGGGTRRRGRSNPKGAGCVGRVGCAGDVPHDGRCFVDKLDFGRLGWIHEEDGERMREESVLQGAVRRSSGCAAETAGVFRVPMVD